MNVTVFPATRVKLCDGGAVYPAAAFQAMVYVPAGVVDSVEIVSVVEQVGLQLVGEKEAVAPVGRPEAVKETEAVVPETSVVIMEFVTELPCVTDLAPPLERERSKEARAGAILEDN